MQFVKDTKMISSKTKAEAVIRDVKRHLNKIEDHYNKMSNIGRILNGGHRDKKLIKNYNYHLTRMEQNFECAKRLAESYKEEK